MNENKYIDNVSNPMSNLAKANDYYQLKKLNAREKAKALGLKIFIKRKGGINVDKINQQIIDKYNNDKEEQQYIATFKMRYRLYDTSQKKPITRITNIIAQGTNNNIKSIARRLFEAKQEEYELQYPENDSYRFDENADLIPLNIGAGIRVEHEREETSVNGGKRLICVRGHKRNMKMRNAFQFFKDVNNPNEWDTNTGKCVIDYLIWKFGKITSPAIFNKMLGNRKKAEEFLNDLFMSDEEDEQNPLEQGVSVQQLERFCDYFYTSMYAYDKSDAFIQVYYPKKQQVASGKDRGYRNSLVFRVFDNHFYPTEDKDEKKKITGRASKLTTNNYKSPNIETSFKTEEKTEYKELVYPTEEEFENLKNGDDDYLSVQNRYAFQYLNTNKGAIQFPISAKNVKVFDGTIDKMIFKDKIVITKPVNKHVREFYKREYDGTDKIFQGETPIDVFKYLWKNKYGFDFTKATFHSKPNESVAKVLRKEKIKWRTHLGLTTDKYSIDEIKEMLISGKAKAFDICKCYCDAVYNQRESFIVFKGKEIMEAYDGEELTLGLYFVETNDLSLFHQSNWYSREIILLAEKEGIDFKITRQIRCVDEDWIWCNKSHKSLKEYEEDEEKIVLENNNLFKPFCDEVIELTEQDEDFTLTKTIINSLTGYLGKTSDKLIQVGLSKSMDEVYYDFVIPMSENNPDYKLYINEIKKNDDKMYLFGYEKKSISLSNGLPMYIQLLDWSNIALYNLSKAVGGEIIYRKTDCVISIGGELPEQKETSNYADTFGTYREEELEKALMFNFKPMNVNRHMEKPELDKEWIDYDFKSSDEWEAIIKTAIEKGGMLISGRAGTGKSYVIGKGIEAGLLDEENETRLAPTNRAARNIKGLTIHRSLAINMEDKTNIKTLQRLSKHKVLIVDEISMINQKLWSILSDLKKINNTTFILMGDFRQCPPVENGTEINYFIHPFAKYLANYNRCELTIPQRYDMGMWNWLEKFYEGDGRITNNDVEFVSNHDKKKLSITNILNRRNITATNKTRCKINEICMKHTIHKLPITNYFEIPLPDKPNDKIKKYADNAYIYRGLPVMAYVNNKEMEIINSDEFIVEDYNCNDLSITLKRLFQPDDMTNLIIQRKDFHQNFLVNYSSTVWKSQGATYEEEINIWDIDKMMDDKRLGYTAVSRARKTEQVKLIVGEPYLDTDDM